MRLAKHCTMCCASLNLGALPQDILDAKLNVMSIAMMIIAFSDEPRGAETLVGSAICCHCGDEAVLRQLEQ